MLDRGGLVSQARRVLIALLGGGIPHCALQGAEMRGIAAVQERDEFIDAKAMILDTYPTAARAVATTDLAGKAGPPALHRAPVVGVIAGADRERLLQERSRLAKRPHLGVRAEVACAPDLLVAGDDQPGGLLAQRDREIRVGLVVLELNVERRLELRDPRVFEHEGLGIGRDDRPIETRRECEHSLSPGGNRAQRLEVVREPGPQILRLADVQYTALAITEPVDPGTGRDLPLCRPECVSAIRYPARGLERIRRTRLLR